MLRIAKSLLTIVAVAIVAVGATGAYFSDQEVVAGNTFTSGYLDLKVDDTDNPTVSMVFADIAPGFSSTYSWMLKNTGNIAGKPTIEFGMMVNNENVVIEPEVGATGENGDEPGELGSVLRMNAYWRTPGGSWNRMDVSNSCGDPILNTWGNMIIGQGLYGTCGADVALPVLNQNDQVEIQLRPFWHNPAGSNHNHTMTDSVVFDITFHLDQ